MIRTFHEDLSELKEVIGSWIEESNTDEMGIELNEEVYLSDLQRLIDGDDSDLLVLEEGKIIGFMGLTIFNSPLGKQRIANEHFFYIIPESRGLSGIRMIRMAKNWAESKQCSHLILNASHLASNMHNKICRLYEKTGFKQFETSYILALE